MTAITWTTAISPEERAAEFSWKQCPGGPGHFAGIEGYAYACAQCNADLIRAAEDEALERAALALGERLRLEGYIKYEADEALTRESAMEIVRALKSGSVKGDRDGR